MPEQDSAATAQRPTTAGGSSINVVSAWEEDLFAFPKAESEASHVSHSQSYSTLQVPPNSCTVLAGSQSEAGGSSCSQAPGTQRPDSSGHDSRVTRAFRKVTPGKSLLVLTDRPDVRRAIQRGLLAAQVVLCFVRTSTELWHRLRDKKDHFDAMIWDLTKPDLQVDGLCRLVRQHERYGRLPIVVHSDERELSETVRGSCSFVVFEPLAAAMLREALLWCFNRKALQGLFRQRQKEQQQSDLLVSDLSMVPIKDEGAE